MKRDIRCELHPREEECCVVHDLLLFHVARSIAARALREREPDTSIAGFLTTNDLEFVRHIQHRFHTRAHAHQARERFGR